MKSPLVYVLSYLSVEDLKRSEKVPCILHMDSIKGTHAGLKKLVQRYLQLLVHIIP